MSDEPLQRTVRVTNPQGFHMRPVTAFSQLASRFQSTVTVRKGDKRANGKSPFDLLMLAAEAGSELTVEVSGPDAADALESLAAVLAAPSADDIAAPPS